jgi:hypothetical protein
VVKVARKSEQRQMFQYGWSTTQISCKTTTEHGKDDSKGKLAHNPMVGWSSEMLPIMDPSVRTFSSNFLKVYQGRV